MGLEDTLQVFFRAGRGGGNRNGNANTHRNGNGNGGCMRVGGQLAKEIERINHLPDLPILVLLTFRSQTLSDLIHLGHIVFSK